MTPLSVLDANRRFLKRAALGLCMCGTSIAQHFDDHNRFIPCDELHAPQSVAVAQPPSSQSSGGAR